MNLNIYVYMNIHTVKQRFLTPALATVRQRSQK